jgi:hypothetical protein
MESFLSSGTSWSPTIAKALPSSSPKDSTIKAATTVMVAQAAKIDQTTLQVPEQKRTSTALDPSPAVKKVCLGLPDASKEVIIRADLDPK